MDTDDPWTDKEFEARVRDTAYFLWENAGRPHGREKEYWFEALERSLRQREADRLLLENPVDGARVDNNDGNPGGPLNSQKGERLEQPVISDDKS